MELLRRIYQTPPTIKITIDPSGHKPFKYPNERKTLIEYPSFYSNEPIKGKIMIELNKNKNLEHQGIKISLFGIIENVKDPSFTSQFFDDVLTLAYSDKINNEITQLDFAFPVKEKPYETYMGSAVRVKYTLCAMILTSPKPLTSEYEIAILTPIPREVYENDDSNKGLKLEIGIDNLLHVVFEIDKSTYYLRDVVVGKVSFKRIDLNVKGMNLQIIRKENLNFGNAFSSETTSMTQYELMDGTPETGMVVPFRFYLSGIRSLTSSFVNVNNKFSVQYFLHLEFSDFEGRCFFKRMEIKLQRLNNMNRKTIQFMK